MAIPGEHVEAVRTSLLELYQVCADALNHAAMRHLRAGDARGEVDARRAELGALERLLAQLGWPGEPVGADARLAGPRPPIREAVWIALTHATADLDERARDSRGGAADLEGLGRCLSAVGERLEMLASVEEDP